MYLEDESATLLFAATLAGPVLTQVSVGKSMLPTNFTIYLKGDLGAGKTCFARGFLRGLGYQGRVKSPTFTLVEPYLFDDTHVYHLDLYRLACSQDLDNLGLRDFLDNNAILLIEWPERGSDNLPNADIEIQLQHCEDPQHEGRELTLRATSQSGKDAVANCLSG